MLTGLLDPAKNGRPDFAPLKFLTVGDGGRVQIPELTIPEWTPSPDVGARSAARSTRCTGPCGVETLSGRGGLGGDRMCGGAWTLAPPPLRRGVG